MVGPTEPSWKKNGKPDPDGLTLVTLNDEVMAAVAGITAPRLSQYANRHHYALLRYEKLLDPSRHASWNKILAVRNALLTRQSEWVMWMDADAMVMDLDFPATRLIDDKVDLIFGCDYNGMNAGIFLIRYCDWSLRFLESTYFLGECYADPDGYNPLWEQSTFKHLIVHFPEVEQRVKILPQAAMNSDGGTYKEGDFILHLAGVPNEKRLETFATFGFKMREGGGALETAS